MGYQSGYYNQNGNYNVTIGSSSIIEATGSSNTFIGFRGMVETHPSYSSVVLILSGYESLKGFTTGYQNVAVGYQAGLSITTGQRNIIGTQALQQNTTSHGNIYWL